MYYLTGLAGIILIIAPYIFGYATNAPALWTSLVAGIVVLVASIWEGIETRKEDWEYWVAVIVGILAILAPFALGFGSIASAMWTSVVMGASIAILAGSKLWSAGHSHA